MATVIRRQHNIDRVLLTAFTIDGKPAGTEHKLYLAEVGQLMAAEHDWLHRRTHRVLKTMLAHGFIEHTDPPPNVITHGHKYVRLALRGRCRIGDLIARSAVTEDTAPRGMVTEQADGATTEA